MQVIKTVAEQYERKFDDSCNKLLKDGWQLFGFPISLKGKLVQSFVKQEKEDDI